MMGLLKSAVKKVKDLAESQEFYDSGEEEYYPALEGDNSRWELETEEQLVNFEQTLRGKKKALDGKSWVPIVKGDLFRPMINDVGIASLLGMLRMLFQKHNALGHIDNERLNTIMRDVMSEVVNVLALNRGRWVIDKKELGVLRTMLEHQIYIFLTRSVDGHEKNYRKKRYPMREHYSHDEVSPSEISTL